jgi:hypothetical protein
MGSGLVCGPPWAPSLPLESLGTCFRQLGNDGGYSSSFAGVSGPMHRFGHQVKRARLVVRPLDGEDLAAQTGITADPATTPVAISLHRPPRPSPTRLVRGPSARPPEPEAPLPRSLG